MKILAGFICGMFACCYVFGCDVCGAVNSSLGLGTIAMGNRHSFGLSYQYRTYKSTHPRLFDEPVSGSTETFRRFDLTGNIRLAKRWQFKTVIPYLANEQQKDGISQRKNGFGDPTASVNYFLIDRSDSLGTRQIRWTAGGGIKAPLGKFPQPHDPVLLLYPGTGTVDGLLQTSLLLRKNKWGLIQETNAVIRGTSKYDYTPGSLINATLFAFRKISDWSVFSGFQYAWNGIDYVSDEPINSSPARGQLLSIAAGISWSRNNCLLQVNGHIPLVQQLGSGYVKQQLSLTAGFFYLLN